MAQTRFVSPKRDRRRAKTGALPYNVASMLAPLVMAVLLSFGPAQGPQAPAADPYEVQAPLDVETILTDSGRGYLDAWGRLEQHPALAAEAILDRLAAIPALGPAERKRLLDILAGLKRPEHVALFAKELRRAVVNADGPKEAEAAAQRWRGLLTEQGASAVPHLQTLVGDKDMPIEVRAKLVQDLVTVTPPDSAGGLVVLLGRGHRRLRRTLRSALVGWAKVDAAAASNLRASADRALEELLADEASDERGSARATALVWFRAHIADSKDTAFIQRLRELSTDDDEAFALRVAAVRGLGRIDAKPARAALESVARDQLSTAKRQTQRGEVLGWVALRQLPAAKARPLVDGLALRSESAPRLASVGYELGSLPRSGPWLSAALANPWPEVRQAALSRVEAPCTEGDLDKLAELGGPTGRGGDRDGAVARSATQAMGRCGGDKAQSLLAKQLKNDATGLEQRAEAGRQLIKRGGPEGLDIVAKVLRRDDLERALVRRLAGAMRFAKAPTPKATAALCGRLEDGGEIAWAAAQSLKSLHKGAGSSPCVDE